MLEVDFHTHSFFSECGIHTHLEILTRARELGMKGVAITDHGPIFNARWPSPIYERTHNPLPGIRYLRGMECNLDGSRGKIDAPERLLKYLDVVLLGIHPNTKKGHARAHYTDLLIQAMEKNPALDILTHTNDASYGVDFEPLAQAARHYGVALELNNSKTLMGQVDPAVTAELVATCKKVGCRMVVNSDMHAIEELGLDEHVRPYLEEAQFPAELLVNATATQAFAFVEERRGNKLLSPRL